MRTNRILLIIFLTAALAAGCGNGSAKQERRAEEKKEYVPEFVTLSSHSSFHSPVIREENLYYVGIDYDKLSMKYHSNVFFLSQGETIPTKLPITLSSEDYIQGITFNTAGNLLLICEESEITDEQTAASTFFLIETDMNGKMVNSKDITSYLQRKDEQSVILMETDQDGNLYLNEKNSNQIIVLKPSGELFFTVDLQHPVAAMCSSKEGTVIAGYLSSPGIEIAEIKPEQRNLGKVQKLDTSGYSLSLSTGIHSDLIVRVGDTIYEYDIQTQKQNPLTDCFSNNITGDSVSKLTILEDGRIFLVCGVYSGGNMKPQLCFLRPAMEGEVIPEKTTIVVGIAGYFDTSVEYFTTEYNKLSPKCRIEMVRYVTPEDLVRLSAELMKGEGPDIIYFPMVGSVDAEAELNYRLPLEQLAEQGILEDLYHYIDSDSELERTDFVENVLKAFEIDGKLFCLPLYFSVDTIVGKTSVLGSMETWNLDEMIAFCKEQRGEQEIFPELSKQDMLNLCLKGNRDELFRGTAEQVSLNTDILLKALEFAGTFGQESESDKSSRADTAAQSLRKYLIYQDSDFFYMDSTIQGDTQFFCQKAGEPVTFIGYPTAGSHGSFITSSRVTLAINANSKHKEEAWQFLRNFLAEDYVPRAGWWGFPIRRDGVEQIFMFAQIFADYVTDPVTKANTEAEILQVRELVDNLQAVGMEIDQPHMKIIREEAELYFNGSKTAEEAIEIMENRIKIYIHEQQ